MKRPALLLMLGLALNVPTLLGQDPAFTYQGRLADDGTGADGDYDFEFTLHDSEAGGSPVSPTVSRDSVSVSAGLFTVILDFGSAAFGAGSRWLEIGVRRAGSGLAFTRLEPRQVLTAIPVAQSARTAETATTAERVMPAAVTTEALADAAITFQKIAPSQVVASLNGLKDDVVLEAGSPLLLVTNGGTLRLESPVWSLQGNAGTLAGSEFLGTTDLRPLELRVNDQPALRLLPATNGSAINLVAGHPGNRADPRVWGATIAGGGVSFGPGFEYINQVLGTYATIGGGAANLIESAVGTISGGFSNVLSSGAAEGVIAGGTYNLVGLDALRATISGGYQNTIAANSHFSSIGGGWTNVILAQDSVIAGGIQNSIAGFSGTISGGKENRLEPGANFSTIGGGSANVIEADAFTGTIGGGASNRIRFGSHRSAVGGGRLNTVGAGAPFSTIGGGYSNAIAAGASAATIPGGLSNAVAGAFGFAAGRRAQANHRGAFVWADSIDADFASEGDNEVAVRATGGVRFVTAVDSLGGPVSGVTLPSGGGSWSTLSDRSSKANPVPVDPGVILERLASLPLHTWSYRHQDPAVRHLGPTAQDFRAAFGLGENDRTIATVDADGVALAAIQGLHRLVQAQADALLARDARIERLESELDSLRSRIESRALRPLEASTP